MILTLRTDKPEAELGLFDEHGKQEAYIKWQAHLQLAETIHTKINGLLEDQKKQLTDISGIIAFTGPGSYTGLRIGISVANALSNSLKIPVIGENGDNWLKNGIKKLQTGSKRLRIVTPIYSGNLYVTPPTKN